MGGKKSKPAPDPEIERLKQERDAKKQANEEELKVLKSNHQEQEQKMDEELASRHSDLENLRKNMVESNRKNDEELRKLRERHAERATELDEERVRELSGLHNCSEMEKQRVNQQFEQRAAQLKEEHDEVISRTLAEKEEERRKAEAAIQKAEKERDVVEKQKLEDVKNHRKELKQMSAEHRKQVEEHYKKLEEAMEKQTVDAIERLALEMSEKLTIVDAAQLTMQQDALRTIYENCGKEFLAISNRLKNIANEDVRSIANILEEVSGNLECEFPHELGDLHSNFNTNSTLVSEQMIRLRNRLKLNLDVSKEFKEQMLAPLEPYEESMKNVKNVEIRFQRAILNGNVKALPAMLEKFEKHRGVLEGISKNMDAFDYKEVVKQVLERAAQKSIQQ